MMLADATVTNVCVHLPTLFLNSKVAPRRSCSWPNDAKERAPESSMVLLRKEREPATSARARVTCMGERSV